MRQDKVRTLRNQNKKLALKKLIKSMRKTPSAKLLTQISSSLDKASKTNLIHANKASRLKSRLSKLIAQPSFANKSKASRLKSRLSKLIVSKPKAQILVKTAAKKTSKKT